MTASAVPKNRLIGLICDDLGAAEEASRNFRISAETSVPDRLRSFTKAKLIAFIHELGQRAEISLHKLESAFPLYRPPTLYLAVVESKPDPREVTAVSRQLAKGGRLAGTDLPDDGPIRFIYLPETARTIPFAKTNMLELTLHYERRVDIVSCDEDSDDYGRLSPVYSLETAFVWLPLESKHKHGIIACCDYPALRHILRFLREKISLSLYLPNLDTSTLHKLVEGATPRSVTFHTEDDGLDRIQNVTLSDPMLSMKQPFLDAASDNQREQTAGFYANHPGLADGGFGIARRDGKIWTPKRLDRRATAVLALKLIQQTEQELGKINNIDTLLSHYYGSLTFVGGRELTGEVQGTWRALTGKILEAQRSANNESELSRELLIRLVRYQERLRLLTAAYYECPNCGVTLFAACPHCKSQLKVAYEEDLKLRCRNCKQVVTSDIECECGTAVEFADYASSCRMVPEPELLESITIASERLDKLAFRGVFVIRGTTVKVIIRKFLGPRRVELSDLKHWHDRAKLDRRKIAKEPRRTQLTQILNRTKEKCFRDQIRPSRTRCEECNNNNLNPKWIPKGDTCLPRLFGVAINEHFDGVHHGRELADIKYEDAITNTGKKVRIGIHIKSRDKQPPAEGMGRSKYAIKGLYTQLVYSAFLVRERGEQLDVLGVSIPNTFHSEVISSLEFVATRLGFPLLAIGEDDWLKVIDVAVEQTQFDYKE